MEKNQKLVMGALSVICALCLVSAVALFFMKQIEVEKRVLLEKQMDSLTKEKTRISKELDDTVILKKDLETKLADVQERVKSTEGQLAEEKRSRESLFSQLETEKRESKRIVEELARLKDEKESIAKDFENIKGETSALRTQLESVQQAKEIVESRLKEILAKSEVDLDKIVVKPEGYTNPAGAVPAVANPTVADQAAADSQRTENIANMPLNPGQRNPASGPTGEVLVINKKFDFIVVSLGEEDGLKVGMDLGVYRDKKMIAMLQVEKVHTNMAAAKIPPEWKNADIKEGDSVVVVK